MNRECRFASISVSWPVVLPTCIQIIKTWYYKKLFRFLNIYRPKDPAATERSVTQGLIQSLLESSARDEAALAAQDCSHPQRCWCEFGFISEAERNRVVFTYLMFLCNYSACWFSKNPKAKIWVRLVLTFMGKKDFKFKQ